MKVTYCPYTLSGSFSIKISHGFLQTIPVPYGEEAFPYMYIPLQTPARLNVSQLDASSRIVSHLGLFRLGGGGRLMQGLFVNVIVTQLLEKSHTFKILEGPLLCSSRRGTGRHSYRLRCILLELFLQN